MMKLARRLESVQEYYFATKLREIDLLRSQGKEIISLAIGGPDQAPPKEVIEALQNEALKHTQHGYQSYQGNILLREAIAHWYQKHYGVRLDPSGEVLPLMGSKEGIAHLCFTYLNEGDEVLVPNPGYATYQAAVRLAGGTCVYYDLMQENDWQIDFDALAHKDLSKIKMMWVNYPHMPTGAKAGKGLFQKLISFAKAHNILICHDNPYSFIRSENPVSILQEPESLPYCIELNSLSKSHNMAGWRVGMLIGMKERIGQVLRFKSNIDSGMFLPIQLAAIKALEISDSWYKDLNNLYNHRAQKAYELATLLGCKIGSKDQVGLFVWAAIPSGYDDAETFCTYLLYRYGLFIVPGSVFGSQGKGYIRISLCSDVSVFERAIQSVTKVVE